MAEIAKQLIASAGVYFPMATKKTNKYMEIEAWGSERRCPSSPSLRRRFRHASAAAASILFLLRRDGSIFGASSSVFLNARSLTAHASSHWLEKLLSIALRCVLSKRMESIYPNMLINCAYKKLCGKSKTHHDDMFYAPCLAHDLET